MSTWIVENFEQLKSRYSKPTPCATDATDTEDYFQEAVEYYLTRPQMTPFNGNHDKTFYFKIRNRTFINRRANIRKTNNLFGLVDSHICLKDYLKWKLIESDWYENRVRG